MLPTVSCKMENFYAFLPFALIMRALWKILNDKAIKTMNVPTFGPPTRCSLRFAVSKNFLPSSRIADGNAAENETWFTSH